MHVPDYEPSKEFFHFLKTVFGILKTLLQTAILLHAPHSLVPSLQHITTFHYFLRWINAFLNSRYQYANELIGNHVCLDARNVMVVGGYMQDCHQSVTVHPRTI